MAESPRLNGLANRHLAGKLAVSFSIGLLIALGGVVPYYRPDLVGGAEWLFKIPGALFMVGLLATAVFGGNLHDASLALAVVVNWVFYGFGIFVILRQRKD